MVAVGSPDLSTLSSELGALLRNSGDAAVLTNAARSLVTEAGTRLHEFDPGAVQVAELIVSANPTANDTIGIGADTYQFRTAAGVGTPGYIRVPRAGSAGATLTNLVTAINTLGTEKVWAKESGTSLLVYSADARGGNIVAENRSVLLAEAITDAADIWTCGNVDMNTLAGRVPIQQQLATTSVIITAAMITGGSVRLSFPFTGRSVLGFLHAARDRTGHTKEGWTDTMELDGNDILVTLAGGVGDLAADDILTVLAYSGTILIS